MLVIASVCEDTLSGVTRFFCFNSWTPIEDDTLNNIICLEQEISRHFRRPKEKKIQFLGACNSVMVYLKKYNNIPLSLNN